MPIAVAEMNGGGPGPTSPTSARMTKAAFFRARSPPIENNQNQSININNDLSQRFELQTRIDRNQHQFQNNQNNQNQNNPSDHNLGRYTPESSSDGHSLLPPRGGGGGRKSLEGYASSAGASIGHHTQQNVGRNMGRRPPSPSESPTSPTGNIGMYSNAHGEEEDEEEGTIPESSVMGFAGGSDEMLMTLLAGQAVVDAAELPVGGWEEVDTWKKELTLLSNRLESLVARHQREVKILTAARTLQKLNNANKRMSKQTMESLEQSEKRVEAAEKEVLVLRDREAALRRRLMEHWSGVMAWEVRRLERVSAENAARVERQENKMAQSRAREEEMSQKVRQLEDELHRRATRSEELEEMVVEMGRRERAMEEEVRDLDGMRARMEELERAGSSVERDKSAWEQERRAFDEERNGWQMEKRMLIQDREMVVKDRQRALDSGRMSDRDRAMMEKVRTGLAGVLGRKAGVGEAEIVDAVEDVRRLLERREDEIARLKEEMREVNMGLEEEVKRVSADRDLWKGKAEQGNAKSTEIAALEKRLRNQSDQITDLQLRNESLSTSLNAAQTAVSSLNSSTESTKLLQNKVNALTAELDSIAGQFNEVWRILPHPARRANAELVDPRTGLSNASLTSPSKAINFTALQQVYTPHEEGFSGIDEMLNRVRAMVDDGRLLVERVIRLGTERELLKNNAARAKKLAEDSRASLETYQQQVAVLEDRLAKSGSSESKFLEELNSLRTALDTASAQKRQLEIAAVKANETCQRLSEANDSLSARALSLAEDAEQEKRLLQKRLQDEVEDVRRQLEAAQEEADENKTVGQSQRIQLLDELNTLQADNAEMRKQLRAVQRGGAGR